MIQTRTFHHSDFGWIQLKGSVTSGLVALDTVNESISTGSAEDALLCEVERLLQDYLKGLPVDFSHIPLAPQGTLFQQKVWQVLCQIPYGETRSYAWIANQVGITKGARAIGQAVGKNPIWIIIPCHRVIQSNGKLGGYAGGLGMKTTLLSLEKMPFSRMGV